MRFLFGSTRIWDYEYTKAPIEQEHGSLTSLPFKEIITDQRTRQTNQPTNQPTDQPTGGHEDSYGNYTANNNKAYPSHNVLHFPSATSSH